MKIYLLMLTVLCCFFSTSCSGTGAESKENRSEGERRKASLVKEANSQELDSAVFAGGCFWCTEAYFEEIFGVREVISGYAGGTKANPTYQQVSSGKTDYAESILIIFNPEMVSYQKLLEVFFYTMDPTQLNRQGNDVGAHYRSAVFYKNAQQKKLAENYIAELDASGQYNKPVVTSVEAYTNFYEAEDYHQDFYKQNPNHPYINAVAKPKKQKFEKKFQELLRPAEKP